MGLKTMYVSGVPWLRTQERSVICGSLDSRTDINSRDS